MILSKTDCMAMQRQVSTCQIDQIFIGFCLTMHDICDTHTLIINYILLVFYNFFLYMISLDKIMTECDSNHWLSQGASFGHWAANLGCATHQPFFVLKLSHFLSHILIYVGNFLSTQNFKIILIVSTIKGPKAVSQAHGVHCRSCDANFRISFSDLIIIWIPG